MRRTRVGIWIALVCTLAACGGSSGSGSTASIKLATAEIKNSDLPNGYLLTVTMLVPRYTARIEASGFQLGCTTPQSVTAGSWKEGLIQIAQSLQPANIFEECGFTLKGSGDPSTVYQDVLRVSVPSYMQQVQASTIGDESFLAALKPTKQVHGQAYELIFRHGNAVIALFHSVTGTAPLTITQFYQLGKRINGRIK